MIRFDFSFRVLILFSEAKYSSCFYCRVNFLLSGFAGRQSNRRLQAVGNVPEIASSAIFPQFI
jgi:hypothetical protein